MRGSVARRGDERAPFPLLVPAAIGVLFLVLPLLGLLIRALWSDLLHLLTAPGVGTALRLSLITSTLATAVSLVLGVPLAWVLARTRLPGRSLLRTLVTVPLVLPPVVGGVALFLVLGRNGIIGSWLYEATGFTIGGIPPFGHQRALRVIMDPDLGRYPVVWAAAGTPNAVFAVPPATLRSLANATVAPLAEGRGADQPHTRVDGSTTHA